MNMVDLFAGIGGFSLAGHLAGFQTVAFVENDDFCQKVLAHHWPEVPILGDITQLTASSFRDAGVGRIDLLCASPPCQSLSVAGRQKIHDDPRYLFPDTARLVAELQPTWVCIENVDTVPRLVLDEWVDDLEGAGYEAGAVVVPAAAVGAPHLRYRCFVVAYAASPGLQGRRERLVNQDARRQAKTALGCNVTGCGTDVADTESIAEWAGLRPSQSDWLGRGRSSDGSGEDVANTASECDRAAIIGDEALGQEAERSASRASRPGGFDSLRQLARDTAGLPLGLDGHPLICPALSGQWPDGPGEAQHDWEPPRTGGTGKNRAKRVKALGNALVPFHVLPILQAIAAEVMA